MQRPAGMTRNQWKRRKRILNREDAWRKAVRSTCGYRSSPIRNVIGYADECNCCDLNKECRGVLHDVVQMRLAKGFDIDLTRPALDKAVKIIEERKKKEEEELAMALDDTDVF